MNIKEILEDFERQFNQHDDIPTKAIDWVDDVLDSLSEEDQYGEKGDILRYILQRLQS
jgi:hypothetical protein